MKLHIWNLKKEISRLWEKILWSYKYKDVYSFDKMLVYQVKLYKNQKLRFNVQWLNCWLGIFFFYRLYGQAGAMPQKIPNYQNSYTRMESSLLVGPYLWHRNLEFWIKYFPYLELRWNVSFKLFFGSVYQLRMNYLPFCYYRSTRGSYVGPWRQDCILHCGSDCRSSHNALEWIRYFN